MIRPNAALLLAPLLVACGGDPNPRPDVVLDASGMITDNPFPFDVQLPFDVPLTDAGTLPDGFLEELLPPDRPPTDVAQPTDGSSSLYTCPTPRILRRVAQPTMTQDLGPLGMMTVYQVPTSVTRSGSNVYYVARDAMGWAIRRVDMLGVGDTAILRTTGPASHLAAVGTRLLFRPEGDDSSIESVDLNGAGRRVEFQHVVIPDGLNERTSPFGSDGARFAFGVRTTGGVRGNRYLLLRKRDDGPEEVIFSRRASPGSVFMPPITDLHGVAVIATTRSDSSTAGGLLVVPLDRAALADPNAMQDDAALTFHPNATLFGPGDGPPGVDCAGSCVELAARDRSIFCVRLSGCAPDNAPTLRRFPMINAADSSGFSRSASIVFDLARQVGARGPANVGRIVSGPGAGVSVLMNLPAPGPGRMRHDLLAVGETADSVSAFACDLPLVRAFQPSVLSISGANEPDMWWGAWTWAN
jgi:hypothetical protein